MTCQCQVCKDIARWKYVIINGNEEQRLELYEELVERVMDADGSVDYYRAIFSGKWPGGKAVLEHALKKYDDTES